MDGVFAPHGAGVRFHAAPDLTTAEVADALATIEPRLRRLLERRGLGDGDDSGAPDTWAEEAPALAGIAAASVQGVAALGTRAGARVRRLGDAAEDDEPSALGRGHARQHGFDLPAGVLIPAGQRERLERLCRYARPAQYDGRRPGAARTEAPVVGWDHASAVRPGRTAGPARGDHAAAADQSAARSRRAGAAGGVAIRGGRARALAGRQPSGLDGGGHTRGRPTQPRPSAAGRPALGRTHAADIRLRRAGVSALRRASATDRPDRTRQGDSTDRAASGPAHASR